MMQQEPTVVATMIKMPPTSIRLSLVEIVILPVGYANGVEASVSASVSESGLVSV